MTARTAQQADRIQAEWDHRRWERKVRRPAEDYCGGWDRGWRTIRAGLVRFSYRVAEVPGGWTWQAELNRAAASSHLPWAHEPAPTRQEAVETARHWAIIGISRWIDYLENVPDAEGRWHLPDCRRVLDRLREEGMFGFVEPEASE